jgi:hypothetical protein
MGLAILVAHSWFYIVKEEDENIESRAERQLGHYYWTNL